MIPDENVRWVIVQTINVVEERLGKLRLGQGSRFMRQEAGAQG